MLSHAQNYINDETLVSKLVRFVNFKAANLILEIGPGKGIITDKLLLERSKKIIAVEADIDLYEALQKKYKYVNQDRLQIVLKDFLKYTLPNKPFIIVSNIPFNITADIVRKITDKHSMLQAAYLIVQKEAAIKLLGAPHAHSPLLSHLLSIEYEIEHLTDISRVNYTPKPKYDTAFISIKKKSRPVLTEPQLTQFKDFLVYIFERNKPLVKKALKTVMSNLQVKIILTNLQIPEDREVKKVLFTDWINIFKTFIAHTTERSFKKVQGSYERLLAEQKRLKKVHRTRKDSE